MLENIRRGKRVTDIVKGVFYSVIKRVLEMDSLTEHVVMTGGVVDHNPYLVKMTEEILGRKFWCRNTRSLPAPSARRCTP